MLLKASCKVKKIHLLTTQDEVSYLGSGVTLCSESFSGLLHSVCAVVSLPFILVLQADSGQQSSALAELKESLGAQGVTLDVQHSSTIHDREIRYSYT